MIKLKDLLTEIAWTDDTLMMAAKRKIPISAPIMKKVIGDVNVSSFHITDIQNVGKIKSLVGKKKSISTFNTYGALASELKHGIGVKTKGGILLSIEGKLMASSFKDIMSQPDESGRRWISDHHLTDTFGVMDDYGIEGELGKNKTWKENYSNLSLGQITALTGKDKAAYIKIYIDTVTALLIKNKAKIKKEFGQAVTDNDGFWNEVVVSQIQIKDALILSDSVPMKFVWDKHPEKDTVSYYDLAKSAWGKKFISKKQIMSIVKKVTTGKVIWGKLTDMPGFIKSRGGSPHEPKISIGVVS
jgi:hypothetical protein